MSGLTMEEARQCRGFWRHAAILHAAAVEDCSLRAPGYSELKEAVARDCQAWTLSSSLLAIVGFAGLLVRPTPVRADVFPVATYISQHLYLISMAASASMALACVNDFISVGNFFNMVPAPYIMEGREHLWDVANKNVPLTQKIQKLGFGFGAQVFYQSIAALCMGLLNFIFLSYGAEFCAVPALIFFVFWLQMKESNKALHWHTSLLPALAQRLAGEPIKETNAWL